MVQQILELKTVLTVKSQIKYSINGFLINNGIRRCHGEEDRLFECNQGVTGLIPAWFL